MADPKRAYFKSIGKCAVCGRRKPVKGRVTCQKCLNRQLKYNKNSFEKKVRARLA